MELVRIPKFSENMEEATIIEWLKNEGDPVEPGDLLLSVITDKADVEVEAESSGTLLRIIAAEKSSVPVSYVVGLVGAADEPVPDYEALNREVTEQFALEAASADEGEDEPPVGTPAAEEPEPAPKPAKKGGRVPASPAAKRLAKEHGVDLAQVQKWAGTTGPVSQEMVEAFLKETG